MGIFEKFVFYSNSNFTVFAQILVCAGVKTYFKLKTKMKKKISVKTRMRTMKLKLKKLKKKMKKLKSEIRKPVKIRFTIADIAKSITILIHQSNDIGDSDIQRSNIMFY